MKSKLKTVLSGTTSALALSLIATFSSSAAAAEPGTDVVETKESETVEAEASEVETTKDEVTEETTDIEGDSESDGDGEESEEDWNSMALANVQTSVNIRKGPSSSTARVGILYKGGAAEILEKGDTWTKVRSGEVEGYIYNKYLFFGEDAAKAASELKNTIATVTASALNVRENASMESTVIKLVYTNDQLLVVEDEEEEFQAENKETTAEDSSETEAIEEDLTEETTNQDSDIAESDEEEAADETWIEIDLGNGLTGFVYGDYVVVEEKLGEAIAIEEVLAEENTSTSANNSSNSTATSGDTASAAASTSDSSYAASSSDLDLMAAIIQCEAGGESYEGKVAVGAVVMNRVRSSSFPNTISGVIYQSGQFSPVASGKLASVLSQGARSDCYEAAQAALNGSNNVGGALYFHAGSGNGLVIGNQTFY